MPFNPRVRRVLYLFLIVAAFFMFGGGVRRNVSDPIHWDVPIYLRDAKMELDQGSMLRRVEGDRILANLAGRRESGLYRRISRYGNVWIITQVLRFGPGGLTGIVHARAVYSLLLLAYLLVLYVFLSGIMPARGASPNHGGAAVVVLLTVTTPLFRYLNGNLVSEVPALLLTTLSCLFFRRGLPSGRAWYSVAAGLLLFLAYTVRMDSCIVPVSMVVAGLWLFRGEYGRRRYWQCSLLFAATYGIGLVVYVLVAGSVVSPHSFLRFVMQSSPLHFGLTSEAGIAVVLRNLAPMLPLVFLSLAGRTRRHHLFSFTWLLLCLAPFAVLILLGAWLESRFLAMVWIPLAVTCLLGVERFRDWSRRLPKRTSPSGARGVAAVVLVVVSLVLYSDSGCRWAQETVGWRIAVPTNEKRVYGIVDIQMIVDELGGYGARFEDLILPEKNGALRCLFQYFDSSDQGGSRVGRSRVFGAVRIKREDSDLRVIRSKAADRLRVGRTNQDQVKIRIISRGEDWALVVCTRPRRLT